MYDNYELITIIFTTQLYTGPKKRAVLVISKENFGKHFGPVFSSRATFFLNRTINPNFWEKDRLQNTLAGIGDGSIDNVIEKRSYINEDHCYKANPRAKRQKLDFSHSMCQELNHVHPSGYTKSEQRRNHIELNPDPSQ
ncbi:hypothetical protein RclHR1_01600019 [Rhizophagus clarus]|uniref:Uncharacterized protein n=1 Tax=Rhizophagus clarus TaxID=94130 RepID=A0A2Z6QGS8_9GLOM|nr:hypothetical protein RclHR1_01600019 [Rhizophagus clarus]